MSNHLVLTYYIIYLQVHNYNANVDVRLVLDGFVRKAIGVYMEQTGVAINRLPYIYVSGTSILIVMSVCITGLC